VASVTELAAKLHRDIAQVSRDLTRLKDVGLVRLEAVGKAKRIVGTERSILVA
jgi:predicted transcriptional regulator